MEEAKWTAKNGSYCTVDFTPREQGLCPTCNLSHVFILFTSHDVSWLGCRKKSDMAFTYKPTQCLTTSKFHFLKKTQFNCTDHLSLSLFSAYCPKYLMNGSKTQLQTMPPPHTLLSCGFKNVGWIVNRLCACLFFLSPSVQCLRKDEFELPYTTYILINWCFHYVFGSKSIWNSDYGRINSVWSHSFSTTQHTNYIQMIKYKVRLNNFFFGIYKHTMMPVCRVQHENTWFFTYVYFS